MQPVVLALLIFLFNVPFGYWRGANDKLSAQWFLAIHLPVPFIVAARRLNDYGLIYVPLFVAFFALGQQAGAKMRPGLAERPGVRGSPCLFVDVWDLLRSREASGLSGHGK
ncbi:MAG: hypothetical protein MAG715_00914 [Methanonatronarchaeales archaeon]|nr:hypothetical protein [Methanonatronarchaeales archaeon]